MKRMPTAAWITDAPLAWHDELVRCFGRSYRRESVDRFAARLAEEVQLWEQTLRDWPTQTPRARGDETLAELRARAKALHRALIAMPEDIALSIGLRTAAMPTRDPVLHTVLQRAKVSTMFDLQGYRAAPGAVSRSRIGDAGALLAALLETLDIACDGAQRAREGREHSKIDRRAGMLAAALLTAWRAAFGATPSPSARESAFDRVRMLLGEQTNTPIGRKLMQQVIREGSPLSD